MRVDVAFEVSGTPCAGWLELPEGDGPHPGVVLSHAFGEVKEISLGAYARRFAAAGIAVLAYDHRHWGSSGGEPRGRWDLGRLHEDGVAALAALRARPEVDAGRVGLWGTSFGGGLSVWLAARDPGVRAVVAQVPFLDGLREGLRTDPRRAARLGPAAAADLLGAALGRAPRYVGLVGHPGETAMLTTPDAVELLDLVPADAPFENRVAARDVLSVLRHRPLLDATRVRCPLLVCIADGDTACAPDLAARLAEAAPLGEALHVDATHFGVYAGEPFEQLVEAQADFLARHLTADRAVAPRG